MSYFGPGKDAVLALHLVRERVDYNPETGDFFWKNCGPETFKSEHAHLVWTARFAGKRISPSTVKDYVVIKMSTQHGSFQCQGHCAAWALMTGVWPTKEIDHKSGDKTNNRFSNLREATHQENNQNKPATKASQTRIRGVYPMHKRPGHWVVQIAIGGKAKHVGVFDNIESAIAARLAEQERVFGKFSFGQRSMEAMPC